MHYKFTTTLPERHQTEQVIHKARDYSYDYPQIMAKDVDAYFEILFNEPSKANLALRSAAIIMNDRRQHFLHCGMLDKLTDNIKTFAEKQPVPTKQLFLETTASALVAIIETVNDTVVTNQAMRALKTMELQSELENFSLSVNQKKYEEAERNYKNSENENDALKAFKI